MWFFQDLIRQNVYTRIDYTFLVVGHTYGPTDRSFGVIERYTKHVETVYTPQHWYEHVRKSSVDVEVYEMEQSTFKDYRQHLRKMYTERSQDINKKPLDFSHCLWFNFGIGEKNVGGKLVSFEHPTEVWVRHTYDVAEEPQCVCYLKKRYMQVGIDSIPPPLYHCSPLPIKKN